MDIARALASIVVATVVSAPATAAITVYSATLSGAAEAPPNASPGTGTATVTVDSLAGAIRIQASFSDLLAPTTVAHIHCCTTPATPTAGVATQTPTFVGFPAGVTSGSFDRTFDFGDAGFFNPAFVTAQGGLGPARSAFLAGLESGTAYFNVHSTMFPAGEIRGFFQESAAPIPEPASYAMMLAGLAAIGAFMRRRH